MVVAPTILGSHGARESARTSLIVGIGLQSSIASSTQTNSRTHTILMHTTSDDIDDAAHSIRTIKQRGRATKHLDTLSHHGLITIGDGMTIDALILRMSIDEHHHLASSRRNTAQHHTARTTCADAITHHTTTGDHQARHLLHQRGQNVDALVFIEFLFAYHADGHRQMTNIGSSTCAGHHNIVDVAIVSNAIIRKRFSCHHTGNCTKREEKKRVFL